MYTSSPLVRRAFSVVVSASMVAMSFSSLVVPMTAYAASNYFIAATSTTLGTTVSISGAASANTFTGQASDQQIAVNWGDGHGWQTLIASGGLNFINSSNNGIIGTTTFATSTVYSVSGPVTVQVGIYHAQPTGHEGGTNTVTFNIVIPPTTGGLIVNKVLNNTGGGLAATSSFSFKINGGASVPFESDGQNVFISMAAGAYAVVEDAFAHYTPGYTGCSGTIVAGATSTCTITNTFFNNPPVAIDSSVTTNEDTATSSSVSATDANSDTLTYSFGSPLHGILSLLNALTGAFTYTPNANYNGLDSFTFSAADLYSSSNTGTVSITVNPVNDNPDAVDDSANVNEDSVDNVIPVLSNDTDAPDTGETLSITGVSSPTNGTAVIDGTTVKYTPTAGFVGSDSFTYTISDGNGGTDTATVNVIVSNTQDAPVANDDIGTTPEDTMLVTVNVLTNDTDADVGDVLSVSTADTTSANGGTVVNNGDGTFNYTPAANFNGSDTFNYTVTDGTFTDSAVVTITVTPVNDAPVAVGQNLSTAQNVPVGGTLGASDIDSNTLTFATTSNPANGTVSFFNPATGAFTYTPDNNYTGSDSFNFKANDGSLDSNTATVSIDISSSPENTPTLCSDTVDNDNDSLIDLADPDCAGFIPTLTVIKNVVNDSGTGTATSSDFTMTVTGTNVATPSFQGSVLGSTTQLGFGSYSVGESGPTGYTSTLSADCSGTMVAGDTKTCTITNDDIAAPPVVTHPQCSDGIDNDGDGRVDYPGDNSCSDPSDDSEGNDGGAFGGGGGGGGAVLGASTGPGLVLGVEDCTKYLTAYIRQGRTNDEGQVVRLQSFLNNFENFNLPVNGLYDNASLAAVNAFQLKYAGDILTPWGATGPTGYVYYTTQKKVNEIYCKFTKQFPLTSDQEAEIARIKALGESYTPAGGASSNGSAAGSVTLPAASSEETAPSDQSQDQGVGASSDNSAQTAATAQSGGGNWFGAIWDWLFNR